MPTIVHFDVASDDPERANRFYEALFNWKIETRTRCLSSFVTLRKAITKLESNVGYRDFLLYLQIILNEV